MTVTGFHSAVENARERGFSVDIADGNFMSSVDPNLLYQAGLCNEALPMIVFSETYLPLHERVNYDTLAKNLIKSISAIAKSDYVIVYFTDSEAEKPGWSWLINTYNSLDRKYKKNLKAVYLVHPSQWTKLLLNTFGNIISNKFYHKLVYVESLSQLESLVPTKYISIPEPVIRHDKHVHHVTTATIPVAPPKTPLFGISLDSAVRSKPDIGLVIPPSVARMFLTLHRLGTFPIEVMRHGPAPAQLKTLRNIINANQDSKKSVDAYSEPYTASSLLKIFFNELSPKLFTEDLISAAIHAPVVTNKKELTDVVESLHFDQKRIRYIKSDILPKIPDQYRILLCHLFCICNRIAHNSSENNTCAFDLAQIWAPILLDWSYTGHSNGVLLSCVSPGVPSVGTVIHLMIQYFGVIFDDDIKKLLDIDMIYSENLYSMMEKNLEQQLVLYRD